MPPDIDSGRPGASVGKTPISSMHRPQAPTSSAAPRSAVRRASAIPKAAAPAAKNVRDTGSSHPSGANAYSLISVCTGSSPVATCSPTIDAAPAPIAA